MYTRLTPVGRTTVKVGSIFAVIIFVLTVLCSLIASAVNSPSRVPANAPPRVYVPTENATYVPVPAQVYSTIPYRPFQVNTDYAAIQAERRAAAQRAFDAGKAEARREQQERERQARAEAEELRERDLELQRERQARNDQMERDRREREQEQLEAHQRREQQWHANGGHFASPKKGSWDWNRGND